jgi:hypothetical protein
LVLFFDARRRVVHIGRHYWCPDGFHNDANCLLRRAFVRRVVPPCVASSGEFRVIAESSFDMGLLSDDCSSVYGGVGFGRYGRNWV